MKNSIAAIILATVASTSVVEASISSLSSSNLGVNPVSIENTISMSIFPRTPLLLELDLNTVAPSPEAAPILVTWSIKSGLKKVGRGAKKVGRGVKVIGKKTGRGIRKANKVIVPSEIRNTARKAKRGVIKVWRYRLPPGKIHDQVPGTKGYNVHDHRTNRTTVIRDHRTGGSKTRPTVTVKRR